jgi:hypothetical protein
MKIKKAIAISIVIFLLLIFGGFTLWGFYIPGNINNLLKTGSYSRTIAGNAFIQNSENGYQYIVDISNEPDFDFVRIYISNLNGEAVYEIFWADASRNFSNVQTTGKWPLQNGINVFQMPIDDDSIQVLKFDFANAPGISFDIDSVMFTNNWYVPFASILLIFIVSFLLSLTLSNLLTQRRLFAFCSYLAKHISIALFFFENGGRKKITGFICAPKNTLVEHRSDLHSLLSVCYRQSCDNDR